ncbi:sigma-54 interaction domain-containing protein [Paenibacillus sp. HJGM_3]|uniref:sigma-54 interaction domain-containing protein n=1 Tax=Paenibacillus sp. HJGM_3 TaxID=3379816 RepID=UPI003859F0ED
MDIRKDGWVHRLMLQQEEEKARFEQQARLYRIALESAYEGIVVADRNGYVLDVNETYASFIERERAELIGRHVTEVIENTRLHIVARTGKAEYGELQKIRGHWMIANRIPVFSDGELIAVVGKIMFQDIDKLFEMNAKYREVQTFLAPREQAKRSAYAAKYRLNHITAVSDTMNRAKALAERVAGSSSTVLLLGESGTGKELFAHAIHQLSGRFYGPFVPVNCAAIPESLFESELFGYKEGSFTGARKSGKPGKLALAHKGTVFLDEIGELSLAMQAKLLRVLEEKEIEPIGGAPESVDIRFIAATNRELERMVEEGAFRRDLYYRLQVIELRIPPLRERPEDIPPLCEELLRELRPVRPGGEPVAVAPAAMEALRAYAWPGNVRELRNVLERAMYIMSGRIISIEDLPPRMHANPVPPAEMPRTASTLREAVEQLEEAWMLEALQATGGDKRGAAERLGMSKSAFYAKLDKLKPGEAKG